jgi:FMN phosphatase YigB (HAD superfamily)
MWSLLLTDVMGTIVPERHIRERFEYALRPDVLAQISQRTQRTAEELSATLKRGWEARCRGEKDSDDFRAYTKITDVGAQIGSARGEFILPLAQGVREAFEAAHRAGTKIILFSNSGESGLRLAMEHHGLGDMIDGYVVSSDPRIGSKYAPGAYKTIAQDSNVMIEHACYVTDDAKEASAAALAGMGKVVLIAQGDAPPGAYTVAASFSEAVAALGL